jgi:hypothetical protein
MVDLWQLAHQPKEMLSTPSKAVPAAPAAITDAPVTIPDANSDTNIVEENSSSRQLPPQSVALPPVKKTEPTEVPAEAPAASSVQKPVTPQKAAVSASIMAANVFESKLQLQLQALALADKVKLQVTANVMTLSGQLTLLEHRELLNLLHIVPPGVRVIDEIEYADETK